MSYVDFFISRIPHKLLWIFPSDIVSLDILKAKLDLACPICLAFCYLYFKTYCFFPFSAVLSKVFQSKMSIYKLLLYLLQQSVYSKQNLRNFLPFYICFNYIHLVSWRESFSSITMSMRNYFFRLKSSKFPNLGRYKLRQWEICQEVNKA